MKKLAALILSMIMVLSVFGITASAAQSGDPGFKVYPFEAFALGSCKLDMTADGAYSFTMNENVNDTYGFISFLASNFNTLDYNAMDYLYLNLGGSVMDFTVKAELHNSLDGYFYPSVEVYSSTTETAANSTVKIPYKQLLEAAGKWDPAGKYLGISINFTHNGDASKELEINSIWLGGDNLSVRETSTVDAEAFNFAEPTFIGNASVVAAGNGFSLTKEVIAQEGYVVKDLPQGKRIDTPYLYINVSQLPAGTTPNLFVKDPDNILTYVRIRPEMAGSNIWLRLDLRNYVNGTAALESENLILRSHNSFMSAGNSPADPIVFGVYSGDTLFNANQSSGGNQKPSNPTTGDTMPIAALAVAAVCAAATIVSIRKKEF